MASIIQLKEEEEENFGSRVPDVGAVLLKFYEAPFLRGNKIRVATTSLLMTKKFECFQSPNRKAPTKKSSNRPEADSLKCKSLESLRLVIKA